MSSWPSSVQCEIPIRIVKREKIVYTNSNSCVRSNDINYENRTRSKNQQNNEHCASIVHIHTLNWVCVHILPPRNVVRFSTKFFWAILEKCETDFSRINQTWCMWKVKSFSVFSLRNNKRRKTTPASQPAVCWNGPSCVFLCYPFICLMFE